MTAQSPSTPSTPPTDTRALWGGVLFSLVFTALIWAAGSRLEAQPLLPDSGVAWYYWRLPEPTFWSRFTAWGFYILHQVANWGLIAYAQSRGLKYTNRLHRAMHVCHVRDNPSRPPPWPRAAPPTIRASPWPA